MKLIDAQNILVEIAESLLELKNLDKQNGLVIQIQNGLQQKYQDYYRTQNFFITKNLTDEETVNFVAGKSENKDKTTPQIARQLPKFNKLYPQAGFECTLATAMLRLALADAGHDTRSLLLRRHFVAMRELEDGSVKIFDSATRITVGRQTHGFAETFYAEEITDKKDVHLGKIRKGYVFTVKTKRKIKNTEMFTKEVNGFYTKQFFAYESDIFVDLAVVLENLSQFKSQSDKYSIELCKKYPYLKKLDFQKMKRDLKLFDGYDYI